MINNSHSNAENGSYPRSYSLHAKDLPYGYLVKVIAEDPLWKNAHMLIGQDDVPVFLKIQSTELFYWHFGKEMLERNVYSSKDGSDPLEITWSQLHCFVSNFAWMEPRWRFLLDKPCWPLHSDVTDMVVSLFSGVRWHELHRSEESPAQVMSFYEMTKYLAARVRESLKNCRLESARDKEGGERYSYVDHNPDPGALDWARSLVHQVLEFEGGLLPPSPVMNTSSNVDRFDDDIFDDPDDDCKL